ncbi:uncharacterized protein PAC_01384 [Phialocephala subalpina]|uniref:Uncharacterized protein n=1 Tax=Phialocephala subalpina TaxID=576137 RepID=A0A1L7WFF6_9HELO|nr:uncharacterized protein PAC_01384 [Phialocephala subalpina]
MRAITMSSNNHHEYLVLQEKRSLYGMRGLEAYASSHPSDPSCLCKCPSTYTPHKNIFAIGATDLEHKFAAIFEDKLHDNIVSGIQATLPDCDWGLNVLRLGFDLECLENPITIHIVVADEALSEDAACNIVLVILEVIAAAGLDSSEMKSIHVDVCRASRSDIDSCSVLDRNPEVYNSTARLPYSSIGPAQINSVGTLSGYIQHRDKDGRTTVYALTCRHVIDPDGILGNKPYVEDSGHPKQQVTCPATSDHKTTIQEINTKITTLQWATEFRNDINTTREITTLDQALKNAMQYNIDLGHIYATSGLGRLLPQFQGRSDWAVMSVTNPAISAGNKHVRTLGSFVSFDHPPIAQVDNDFRYAATKHFNLGPYFKPVRDDDLTPGELVFKPRSRTTNKWVGGTFNAIRSTQKTKGRSSATRELCLIALNPQGFMSAKGDSGSIIVDRDFRPVAIIWGGDTHYFATGPKDVTYASPLSKTLRDIESCLQWAEGSVSLALDES